MRSCRADPAALALPLVSSGGQFSAHAPEHVLLAVLSFWNRYSVRPLPCTREVPSLPCRVLSVADAAAAWLTEPAARHSATAAARAIRKCGIRLWVRVRIPRPTRASTARFGP